MICKKRFQTKLAVSFFLGFCATSYASQQTSKIGAVYSIAETDALEAIKARAETINWNDALRNRTNSWMQLQQTPLPRVEKDNIRFHKPTHILEKQITDANGVVIYPSGFEFNPLNHMRLPYRIVVVSMPQLKWLKKVLRKTDRVLLTSGDVFKARDYLGHTVFLLDQRTKERLNVLKVPSLIVQKSNLLEISEIKLDMEVAEVTNVN
ncbi:hypothetical protein [Pseudoalteromonas galatheae]|uniref:hypothetical protein n=1 Tax=Pseudoalteromonas galatheae TaxID=579562 RepID=UPI0030CE64D6